MSLLIEYEQSKKMDNETKINMLVRLMREYPKSIDYVYNRMDSCFGGHIVYLAHMKVDDLNMLKLGYTKNDVVSRYKEKRYEKGEAIEIVEVIRKNKLQAKGAVDFEKKLKEFTKDYKINSNLTLPGKNEFLGIEYREKIIELYDTFYEDYKNVEGLKSPN
jgi:hypothetical protein